jgi:hypothetical protein
MAGFIQAHKRNSCCIESHLICPPSSCTRAAMVPQKRSERLAFARVWRCGFTSSLPCHRYSRVQISVWQSGNRTRVP